MPSNTAAALSEPQPAHIQSLRQSLSRLSLARVAVVGDVMLDRYWVGSAGRISPEAPVPVLRVTGREDRIGGAGNVAANAVGVGALVALCGVVGRDDDGRALEALCAQAGIRTHFLRGAGPTTVKLRMLAQHQQLLRVDFERVLPTEDASNLFEASAGALPGMGAVVLSDYAKGVLHEPSPWIAAAHRAGAAVVVDPKSRDFARYAGADVVTPNLGEFEAVVGRPIGNEADLVAPALALCAEHRIGALLITRGEHGMTLVRPGCPVFQLPAQAREVFDVTGAGDTVCALLACGLAAGLELEDAVTLANVGAGISVGKLGTSVVTLDEIQGALAVPTTPKRASGPMALEEAVAAVRSAQAEGQRVVVTNGCFDILHPGHVRYLNDAAALGDRLLVAVNSDASVRRLKGPARPVNPLASRMEVLAGLRSVDWVVPFEDDTPLELIRALAPDVLVKGGDYSTETIVGAQDVLARGGQVMALPFHEGHSSSAVIAGMTGSAGQPR